MNYKDVMGEDLMITEHKPLNQDLDRDGANPNNTATSNVQFIDAGTHQWQYLIAQAELTQMRKWNRKRYLNSNYSYHTTIKKKPWSSSSGLIF